MSILEIGGQTITLCGNHTATDTALWHRSVSAQNSQVSNTVGTGAGALAPIGPARLG
jgi:hypothetical protein